MKKGFYEDENVPLAFRLKMKELEDSGRVKTFLLKGSRYTSTHLRAGGQRLRSQRRKRRRSSKTEDGKFTYEVSIGHTTKNRELRIER